MRIGELSARTGASPRSLRHYEAQGVLQSERSANGYRSFPPAAVDQVALVRLLLSAGLPMEVIRDVSACAGGQTQQQDSCRAIASRMAAVRDRLETQAARLTEQVSALDGLIRQASRPVGQD